MIYSLVSGYELIKSLKAYFNVITNSSYEVLTMYFNVVMDISFHRGIVVRLKSVPDLSPPMS